MDFSSFSLLYPDAATLGAHFAGKDQPDIAPEVLDQLGLSEILGIRSRDLTEFFTKDPEVIRYREETFADMMENDCLSAMLEKLVPVLRDILELRRLEADSAEGESYLSAITEIELYTSSVGILYDGLRAAKGNLHGAAFLSLAELVEELVESDYYRELNEKLNDLTERVREIRSVTIGVNLDAQLRPKEAGVLSINPLPFKSGDVLEKILRFRFKNDEYTCIANLVPFAKNQTDNQKTALTLAFHTAINDVYRSSLHSWKKIIETYVLEKTDFLLDLMPEFELLVRGTALMKRLGAKNCPLCRPEIRPMNEVAFDARDLANPAVALKISGEIVPNDVTFDDKARVYVLSGPNRGGKSVVTCAVGLAVAMLQLGLYIPAKSAVISPADAIFTHFPTGAEDTIDKGRLGEECARLGAIFDRVTEYSLVLLDESFSSTGAYEASYIAAEVLAGFARVGCRTIFSTHLHELAARLEDEAFRKQTVDAYPIDTLVAGMEAGQRSFKILRKRPDGKSYAHDIAVKYGLTYDSILNKINHNHS